MRGSVIHRPINSAEGLAWCAMRLVAAGLHQVWRGCQTACWWFARQRTRRALEQLDDRMLNDIGITREQALREAGKPFWMA